MTPVGVEPPTVAVIISYFGLRRDAVTSAADCSSVTRLKATHTHHHPAQKAEDAQPKTHPLPTNTSSVHPHTWSKNAQRLHPITHKHHYRRVFTFTNTRFLVYSSKDPEWKYSLQGGLISSKAWWWVVVESQSSDWMLFSLTGWTTSRVSSLTRSC